MTAGKGNRADWIASLATEQVAEASSEALRSMPMARIRSIPTPRSGGLPFGNELAVIRRRREGLSCHMLSSCLSHYYQTGVNETDRLAFKTLVLGQPAPRDLAEGWLGGDLVRAWTEAGWFEVSRLEVRPQFRVVCVGPLTLAVDPMGVRFRNRVHIGQDSITLVEFLHRAVPPGRGRLLDVGTGSGVAMLCEASRGGFDEIRGTDINPRAVLLAKFNARLNGCRVRVELEDVFAKPRASGRFDRVVWNAPFRFFPDDYREDNLDGFGGHLGIGLTLDFARILPDLLAEDGDAFVLTAGPLLGCTRPLDEELAAIARAGGLDADLYILGTFFDPRLATFHASHGVSGFESGILWLQPGRGMFRRHEASLGTRTMDWLRWAVQQARVRRWIATPSVPAPPDHTGRP